MSHSIRFGIQRFVSWVVPVISVVVSLCCGHLRACYMPDRHKVIRAGLDAWQAHRQGRQLRGMENHRCSLGSRQGLRPARHWREMPRGGRNYSRTFNEWIKADRFDKMPKSLRSVAIELHENVEAITAWRSTLSERDRRRLKHPLSPPRRLSQIVSVSALGCPFVDQSRPPCGLASLLLPQ